MFRLPDLAPVYGVRIVLLLYSSRYEGDGVVAYQCARTVFFRVKTCSPKHDVTLAR